MIRVAVALTGLLVTAGCSYEQQARHRCEGANDLTTCQSVEVQRLQDRQQDIERHLAFERWKRDV